MTGNLFLPSHKDRKRPLLLRPISLFIYIFFLGLLIFGADKYLLTSGGVLGYATDIKVETLLSLTNKVREQKGLDKLVLNTKLSKAAELKAQDMFKEDYWAHTSPTGKEPWDFIKSQGYYYVYAGENLAVDFSDSEEVVKAWYKSPSHKENLINPNYSEIGFAVVNGELQGRKTTLVVQMFGRPRFIAAKATTQPDVAAKVESEIVNSNNKVDISVTQPKGTVSANNPVDTNSANLDDSAEIDKLLHSSNVTGSTSGNVLNATDVFSASRLIALVLGAFLTILFAVDGYYVRKLGIMRITGHTILHIVILVLVTLGIWYTNIGLVL